MLPTALTLVALGFADAADADALRRHGLADAPAALLAYFRERTLDEPTRRRVRDAVARLGHERFAVREQAGRELLQLGPAVRPLLEAALPGADAETTRRLQQCLAAFAAHPRAGVAATAVRA